MNLKHSNEPMLVELKESTTLVRTVGEGEPVVVINGGPGFGHSYMYRAMKKMLPRKKLIFFDQIGSGGTESSHVKVTARDIRHQLVDLIDTLVPQGSSVTLLCHSWGSYVAYDFLANEDDKMIKKVFFIEPLPPTWSQFQKIIEEIWHRTPEEVRVAYEKRLSTDPDNILEKYRMVLPFYVHTPSTAELVEIDSFTGSTLKSVYASIKQFDFTHTLQTCHSPSTVVLGTSSFISIENLSPLSEFRLVEEAGHYPFCEVPSSFVSAVPELFMNHKSNG